MSSMENRCPDLTPRPDNPITLKLHQERVRYESEIKELRKELKETYDKLYHTRKRLKEELITAHRTEYDVFYNNLMNLKTIELILSEEYSLLKYNLLKQLRSGMIDNSTYRRLLKEPGEKANQAGENVYKFYTEGIAKIFGDDKKLFNINSLDP